METQITPFELATIVSRSGIEYFKKRKFLLKRLTELQYPFSEAADGSKWEHRGNEYLLTFESKSDGQGVL